MPVVFDDKRILGLLDEGFHDALEFENEFKGSVDESNDEENQSNERGDLIQL